MNYAPEIIGVGKYTTELAEFLAGRGHQVEVVAALPHYPGWSVAAPKPWWFATTREAGVRIIRCPLVARPGRLWRLVAPLSFALAAGPVVIWRALLTRPRTVLCIEPTLLAAPAALVAARLVGARTILHVQDLECEAAFATGYLRAARGLVWAARAYERFLRRRFDHVVTISEAMANRLQPQLRLGSVTVLRNWMHLGREPEGVPREAVRRGLKLPDDRRLVLYAGNLGAKQGLPVLVEAARHLRADPSIHFLIVGGGVMASRLRAAAASLPNLTLAGLLPPQEHAVLLAAADLHILPQERAASDLVFPSKLGPLLGSGRPILVTAEPQSELARWLGTTAILVHPGDSRALAAAIRRVVSSPPDHDPGRVSALLAELDADVVLPALERCLLPEPAAAAARCPEPLLPPQADVIAIA